MDGKALGDGQHAPAHLGNTAQHCAEYPGRMVKHHGQHSCEVTLVNDGFRKGEAQGLEQGRTEGLQQGLQQGRTEGLQQGLEQGLQQGRTEAWQQNRIQHLRPYRRHRRRVRR